MEIPMVHVIIGRRRREDLGDIGALARSIQRYGLLHPIVVDDGWNLIAGERRFRACHVLGWDMIPARLLGELTEAERREIELEENLQRKDLAAFERSKTMVALVEMAAEVLAREPDFSADSAEKSRGRPPKRDAQERVAERTALPQTTISKAMRHVETGVAYPFMQAPDWKQYHVLEARERLEKLPDAERASAAALLDQPDIPPREAVKILANLSEKPALERAAIYELHQSTDRRDRSLALTKAADKAPAPDPRVLLLSQAIRAVEQASGAFPDDPLVPRYQSCITMLRTLQEDTRGQAEQRQRRREAVTS